MKILHTVEFYDPHVGGHFAVRAVSELLAKRGHSVTIATSFLSERKSAVLNGVRVEQFKVRGSLTKGINGESDLYREFIVAGDFDVITNFFADVWTTDLAFALLPKLKAVKVLSTPGLSKLSAPTHRAYFSGAYRGAMGEYDRIVYTSPSYQDKLFGDAHGFGSKAVIIPNGAGDEFLAEPLGFRKRYGIATRFMLLTVANHYFLKGHDFVIEAFSKMQRDDTTLVLIGEKPSLHSWYSCWPLCKLKSVINRGLRVLGKVPRPWVVSANQEADLILFGSRVECAPLVMYEAFASKTPFITTEVGNVKDHADVVTIVGTPERMATEANELLKDEKRRGDLAERAFQLWRERHTWKRIASEYEDLYEQLVHGRSA